MEARDGMTPSGAGAPDTGVPDAGVRTRGKRLELSAELLSILLVGVALAALILTGIGEIREDMRERFSSMESRMSSMENRMSSMEARLAVVESRLAVVESQLAVVERRLAVVESQLVVVEREQGEIRGLLEGLRDTAAGRPEAQGVELGSRQGHDAMAGRSANLPMYGPTTGSHGDSGGPAARGGDRRGSANDTGPGGTLRPVIGPAGRGTPDAPVTLRAAADAPPP